MQMITHVYGPVAVSMARAANKDDDKIYWDSDKYVEYKQEGNSIIIEEVHMACGEWESLHSFDKFSKLKMPYKRMIAAACLTLGVTTVIVGADMVTFVQGAEEGGVPSTQPLTNQPYAISGNRVEIDLTDDPKVNVTLPTIRVSGKVALGLAIGVGLVIGGCALLSRN